MPDRIVPDSAIEEKGKKRARAYCRLGDNYLRANLLDDAIVAFTKAAQCDPEYSRSHNNLGIIYAELGKFPEAIEAYKNAILIDPGNALHYCNLGGAYADAGKAEIALEAYLAAIQVDPNYYFGYFTLGTYYQSHSKHALALENFKKSIELKPNFAQGYVNIGMMYHNLSKTKPLSWRKRDQLVCFDCSAKVAQALAAFTMALELDPQCESAYYQLGIMYKEMVHYDEAIRAFKKLLSLNDKSENAELAKSYIDEMQKRTKAQRYNNPEVL